MVALVLSMLRLAITNPACRSTLLWGRSYKKTKNKKILGDIFSLLSVPNVYVLVRFSLGYIITEFD